MHIAVCDDSMIERKIIMNALYEYASMHSVHFDITEYDSGMNLLYDVQDGQDYNLVFLDIIMDEISGIDVAHRIREANSKSSIVFLTASPDFAVSSYDVDAVGYLLKPLETARAFAILDKVMRSCETQNTRSIKIPPSHMSRSIRYSMWKAITTAAFSTKRERAAIRFTKSWIPYRPSSLPRIF